MKIMLITSIFPPDIGGPAQFMERLALALHDRGHKVVVLCASPRDDVAADRRDWPFTVRRLQQCRVPFKIALFLNLLRHGLFARGLLINNLEEFVVPFLRFLRPKRAFIRLVGDYLWEESRNLGTTIESIEAFQDSVQCDPTLASRRRKYVKLLRQATGIIVPGHFLNGLVMGWGMDPNSLHVVANGAPVLQHRAGSVANELRFVYAGRLVNWKGLETLLIGLCGLRGVPWRLTIIGEGPERYFLHRLAELNDTEGRITFMRAKHGDALFAELSRHNVFVLPSSYEGMSNALLEALSMGFTILASDIPANTELIKDGDNGITFRCGDVDDFRMKVQLLWTERETNGQLAANAKMLAERMDIAVTLAKYTALLEGEDNP